MAYYSSGYHDGNYSDCYNMEPSSIPYYQGYDSALFEDPVVHQFSAYDHSPYYSGYESMSSSSRTAYFVSSYGERPVCVEYDPGLYSVAKTQFIVSYSVSDFNEPEFEEYDPTPYGGGYDPVAEYGKPLSPSDKICYPRSTSSPGALPSSDSAYNPVVAKKEDVEELPPKPETESKPSSTLATDEIGQQNDQSDSEEKSLDTYKGEDLSGYGKQYVPAGYGLEAMDICESLFGYWPCLAKYATEKDNCQDTMDRHYCNPWNGTADYLFGNTDPYSDRRDEYTGSYANTWYDYQRHFLEEQESLYQQVESVQQVEYVVDPWLS